MITDTGGRTIEITTESQLGFYQTTREVCTFLYRRPDGSCFLRLKDGTEYETKPSTVVRELPY